MPTPLILASQSPRRKELLGLLGIPFTTQPAHVDETPHPHEAPLAYVTRIAMAKAAKVAQQFPGHTVLAADTPVILHGTILQSPATAEEAAAMLAAQSGHTVHVPTVVVVHRAAGEILRHVTENTVTFRPIAPQEIAAYVAQESNWRGISGAFKIQETASVFIQGITGSPTGIIGLPLLQTATLLRQAGYPILGL